MNNKRPQSFSEQLKEAQTNMAKLAVIESAINMLLHMFETLNDEVHKNLVGAVNTHSELFNALAPRLAALEVRGRVPRPAPTHMSSKMMLSELGLTGDVEKSAALKFFARQYCTDNNLEIVSNSEEGRSHERFPLAACKYAMEKLTGEMKK